MRIIDLGVDSFGHVYPAGATSIGAVGSHKSVTLRVRLPSMQELSAVSYYRMVFTQPDKVIKTSAKIFADGEFISFALPFAVTNKIGQLLMQVQAIGLDDDDVDYLWPTMRWEFRIEPGVSKTLDLAEITDPIEGMLEWELQQLINLTTGTVSLSLSRYAMFEQVNTDIDTMIDVSLFEGGNLVTTDQWSCHLNAPSNISIFINQMEDRYVVHITRIEDSGDLTGDIEILAEFKGGTFSRIVSYITLPDEIANQEQLQIFITQMLTELTCTTITGVALSLSTLPDANTVSDSDKYVVLADENHDGKMTLYGIITKTIPGWGTTQEWTYIMDVTFDFSSSTPVYQKSGTDIILPPNACVKISPDDTTTIILPEIPNSLEGTVVECQLEITITTPVSIILDSITWRNGEILDISTAGQIYSVVLRTTDDGETWLGMWGAFA